MKNNSKIILFLYISIISYCIFLLFIFVVSMFYCKDNSNILNQYNKNDIFKPKQEYYNQIKSSDNTNAANYEKALTDEEAEELRGTGYHNTRPNSSAESMEIQAAKVKCKKCGMRSHNGLNSLCDSCLRKEGLIKDN